MTTADLRDFAPRASTQNVGLAELVGATATSEADTYTGKHRKSGLRMLSITRLRYRPRHAFD